MAISRMQEPRQLYGLGSLVKKAVRGVKKIVKSPLGKAALIGGLGYGLGAVGPGGFNKARLLSRIGLGGFTDPMKGVDVGFQNALGVRGGPVGNKFTSFLASMNPFGDTFKGRNLALGLGATAVATPFIQKAMGVGPYEEIEEEVDESYIDPYSAMMMARNRDPYMSFLPNEQFAQQGFYLPQNAANGGRIGYADGMMVEEEDEMLGLPTLRRRGFANGENGRS